MAHLYLAAARMAAFILRPAAQRRCRGTLLRYLLFCALRTLPYDAACSSFLPPLSHCLQYVSINGNILSNGHVAT